MTKKSFMMKGMTRKNKKRIMKTTKITMMKITNTKNWIKSS